WLGILRVVVSFEQLGDFRLHWPSFSGVSRGTTAPSTKLPLPFAALTTGLVFAAFTATLKMSCALQYATYRRTRSAVTFLPSNWRPPNSAIKAAVSTAPFFSTKATTAPRKPRVNLLALAFECRTYCCSGFGLDSFVVDFIFMSILLLGFEVEAVRRFSGRSDRKSTRL